MTLLPLPLSAKECRHLIIEPALLYLPAKLRGVDAQILLLANALQESGLKARRQMNNGPARGLWQNERGGMVRGVMKSKATSDMAKAACVQLGIAWDEETIYNELATNDMLAAVFARLGLWANPQPLPKTGDIWANWNYYLETWRPGQPRREDWPTNYATSLEAYKG